MQFMRVYESHKTDAHAALALFRCYCNGTLPPRVPGMDTVIRLAWRLAHGRTIEQAAAREYVYRWQLAVKPFDQCEGAARNSACSIFGTPHTFGM